MLNFLDFRKAWADYFNKAWRRNRLRKQRNNNQYRRLKLKPEKEAGLDYSDSQDDNLHSGFTLEL